ncbi:M23 family metallopeptidase [Natrinema zhouii]|uniref:M23 family metallopeptidase n=1 Tax=Natrinema zhouii TaxID=1710539 RepID=A0A7D6GQF2_9EURY|nr:M23 family metallopeptidase [Natrinema zhouii]QLK25902.1 M23 family metallopeptidase [Natrinema zhouii]
MASTESTGFAARLRQRLRSFEPMYLAFLGLLALPSYVFDSLAFLELFEAFFLFFLWPFVGPLIDMVLRRRTDEEATEPTDWIDTGGGGTYAAWLLTLPLTLLNPLVLAQDAMQLLGTAVAFARHRGSFPDAGSYDQRVSYRLPFDGTWTVVNGSHDHDYSHSWLPVNQRYAYDFVITDADGRTSPERAGSDVDAYYCYDEPVVAPADGVVVDVFDDAFEAARGGGISHPLKRDIRGNYVVIQHAPDEYSCLAHLVPGSATVEAGDRVARGQRIGRCGHSGNSSEPHLHFQVQDHPDFELAAGLPVAFDDVAIEWPGVEAPVDDPRSHSSDGSDRPRSYVTAGQRVAHVDRDRNGGRPSRDSTVAPGVASEVDGPELVTTSSGRRPGIATLQGVSFGVCVGGVVTYFVSIVASWSVVAVLLGGGAALGAAARIGSPLRRGGGDERRSGSDSMGTVVGVGLIAAIVVWVGWAAPAVGFGLLALGALAFLTGFVGYVGLGEYDRLRLRESFHDHDGVRPV